MAASVAPRAPLHLTAFALHLRYQRGLLFDCPFSPSLDPCDDLPVGHTNLLLELQKESPAIQSMGDSHPPRYTSDAGRLRRNGPFSRTKKRRVLKKHLPMGSRLKNGKA